MKLTVNVTLSEHDLRDAAVHAKRREALDLIIDIDAAMADVDFTEALIKHLVISLRGDLDEKEFDALIANLARKPKMGNPELRQAAIAAVDALLTNSNGDVGTRLAIRQEHGDTERDLGGWCWYAAVETVEHALESHMSGR